MNENKNQFLLEKDITYLNHGSFGACSKVVFQDYQNWQVRLEKQPVQFLTEELYSALKKSRESLSLFLGCDQDEVLFFQNPTTAISNIIYNLDLNPGDEVLMTDHEYGALVRAWNAWGKKAKVHIKYANVTLPLESKENFFEDISSKISSKTKVLFLSQITSTTGLVFPIKDIIDFAKDKNLWVIKDNCDALGSKYNNKLTGTFGDISTLSFYPAHHITMGEGGAVITDKNSLKLSIDSFRDWGRDCWCKSGHDDTCNKRFDWQLGDLPYGYDHKFTYSNIGYNLKPLDLQGSIGIEQLKKFNDIHLKRRKNKNLIENMFEKYVDDIFIVKEDNNAETSWFGVPIVCKNKKLKFNLVQHLEKNRIQTRNYFAGNILLHPAYSHLDDKSKYPTANQVLEKVFFVGCSPTYNDSMLNYFQR